MATTKSDIQQWFERGQQKGATHMVVVCDTFDWEDYPVFAFTEEEARKHFTDYSNMKKPMECYKLTDDMQEQLALHRCKRF